MKRLLTFALVFISFCSLAQVGEHGQSTSIVIHNRYALKVSVYDSNKSWAGNYITRKFFFDNLPGGTGSIDTTVIARKSWVQTYTANRFSVLAHTHSFEPLISKSTGFLKWSGSSWSWDNSTYVTGTPWTLAGYITSLSGAWLINDTSTSLLSRTRAGHDYQSKGNYVTGTPWADMGYLTSFTELDPGVSAWAKAATKPTYTYTEVGAQVAGSYAASSHNHNLADLSEKSYNSLTDKPTIPAAQVQTDWNAVLGLGVLLNKPSTFTPSAHDQAWSTITSGVPTTLSGYGITDAAPLNNASMTGTFAASGGIINLNVSSNNATNIGTGTTTSTVQIGGSGTQTIQIGDQSGTKTVQIGDNTGAQSGTTIIGGTNTVINGGFCYGAGAGSATVYTLTLNPALTAYTVGQIIIMKAVAANTGAGPTLNVNALGAKTIVKRVSTALAAGDIALNKFCLLVYDGTNFVLLNPTVN